MNHRHGAPPARQTGTQLKLQSPQRKRDPFATVLALRPPAGYKEGYAAAVLAIKANEAIVGGKRIFLQKEGFELGDDDPEPPGAAARANDEIR